MSAEDFVIEMNNPLLRTSSGRLPYGETVVCYESARWNWQGIPTWKNPFTKWDGRSTIGMFYDDINRLWHPEDITKWQEINAGECPATQVPFWINDWRLTHVERTSVVSQWRRREAGEAISSSPNNTGMFASAVFKRGTATQTYFGFYDFTAPANRGMVYINWDSISVVGNGNQDDFGSFWLDDDTVWAWVTSSTLTPASDNEVLIYPEVKQADPGGSVYVTAVQAGISDDSSRGPHPYSATGIGSSRLMYQMPVSEDGAIQMWVMTAYPGSKSHDWGTFIRWVENTKTGASWTSNNHFAFSWTATANQLQVLIRDTGGTQRVATSAFNPNSWTDFEWHHVVLTWAGIGSSGSIQVYIDGIKDMDQTIAAHTFDTDLCSSLFVCCGGQEKQGVGNYSADQIQGWLGEFGFYTDHKDSIWVAKDYARTRPLYKPNRILLTDSEAMVSAEGWAVRNLAW